MTTLAIIGSGIVGRSLIYALAKQKKSLPEITLYSADEVTAPCTFNSTAIVAPRGVTQGHSALGDSLIGGFSYFTDHFEMDSPNGVERIIQYTGVTTGVDKFRKRYPHAELDSTFLKESCYLSRDVAFMIDPISYCDWLLSEARKNLVIDLVKDLVIGVEEGDQIKVVTQKGHVRFFDQVVFACGSYNRFWSGMAPESKLKTSKPVQGSYFEFSQVQWNMPSLSLTLDGDNIVWNAPLNRLFVGSTTTNIIHLLPQKKSLELVYRRLSEKISLSLPSLEKASIKTGLREKAQKREPYVIRKNNIWFFGGLYKNAFTLSLKMANELTRQLL